LSDFGRGWSFQNDLKNRKVPSLCFLKEQCHTAIDAGSWAQLRQYRNLAQATPHQDAVATPSLGRFAINTPGLTVLPPFIAGRWLRRGNRASFTSPKAKGNPKRFFKEPAGMPKLLPAPARLNT
jgi:hypothetical protein